MKYLYPNHVLFLHKQIIERSGSSGGVRDWSLLESAVYQPQQSFGGVDLYKDVWSKAAALAFSIAQQQIRSEKIAQHSKSIPYFSIFIQLRLAMQLHSENLAKGKAMNTLKIAICALVKTLTFTFVRLALGISIGIAAGYILHKLPRIFAQGELQRALEAIFTPTVAISILAVGLICLFSVIVFTFVGCWGDCSRNLRARQSGA